MTTLSPVCKVHIPNVPHRTRKSAFDVKRSVADAFSITIFDLIGPSRVRHIVEARFAAYHMLQETQRFSLAEIGRHLGGRHHTTVMDGILRCEELLDADPDFAARYEEARRG